MEDPWPGPGQAIISIAQFYFEREVRTATGECYTILVEDKTVGRLGLHFVSGMVHGTLAVSESLTQ